MERVTFLVERTGERIPCLLNPESLQVRRSAGIVRRRGGLGAVIGNPRTDDPLVATGGGITEYELNLLFDVDLMPASAAPPAISLPPDPVTEPLPVEEPVTPAGLEGEGAEEAADTPADPPVPSAPVAPEAPPPSLPPVPSPPPSIDVRTLTQPLWALAENGEPLNGTLAPQRVRLIWGRSWNVPGVILAVAERHERFDGEGVPKRSWLSLLLRRVEESVESAAAPPSPTSTQFEINSGGSDADQSNDDSIIVPVDDEGVPLAPLHMIAADRYGDPRYGRAIAEYNDLDDMLELEEGRPLRLPPSGTAAAAS